MGKYSERLTEGDTNTQSGKERKNNENNRKSIMLNGNWYCYRQI